MTRAVAMVLSLMLALPACAPRSRALMRVEANRSMQTPAAAAERVDAWRSLLERLPAGARVRLRLADGRTIRATLLQTKRDEIVVTPRTRIPEPVQTIAFADLVSIDVETDAPSMARMVGIGVASGVAAFFGMLLIMIASIED
jgi:hypothetical protein